MRFSVLLVSLWMSILSGVAQEEDKEKIKKLETIFDKALQNAPAFTADIYIIKIQSNKTYALEGKIKVSRRLQKIFLHLKKYEIKEMKEDEENKIPKFDREDTGQEMKIYLDENGFEIIGTEFPPRKLDFSNIKDLDEILPFYLMLFGFDKRIRELFDVHINHFGDEKQDSEPGADTHEHEGFTCGDEDAFPWLKDMIEEAKKHEKETPEPPPELIEKEKELLEKMKNTLSITLHPKAKELKDIVYHIHAIFNIETFVIETYNLTYANGDPVRMEIENINKDVELEEKDFQQEVK